MFPNSSCRINSKTPWLWRCSLIAFLLIAASSTVLATSVANYFPASTPGMGKGRVQIPESLLENGILESIAKQEMDEENGLSEEDWSSGHPENSQNAVAQWRDSVRQGFGRDQGTGSDYGDSEREASGPDAPVCGLRKKFETEDHTANQRVRSGGAWQDEDGDEEPPTAVQSLQRENAELRSRLLSLSHPAASADHPLSQDVDDSQFVLEPSEHALNMMTEEQREKFAEAIRSKSQAMKQRANDAQALRRGVKRSRGSLAPEEPYPGERSRSITEMLRTTAHHSRTEGEQHGGSFWRELREDSHSNMQDEQKRKVVAVIPGVSDGVGGRLVSLLSFQACMLWEDGMAARLGLPDASFLSVADVTGVCNRLASSGGLGRVLVESSRAFGNLKGLLHAVGELSAMGVGGVLIGDVQEEGWGVPGKGVMSADGFLRAVTAAVTARADSAHGMVVLARTMTTARWAHQAERAERNESETDMVEAVVRRLQGAMGSGADGVVIDVWEEGEAGLDVGGFRAVCERLEPRPQLLMACVHGATDVDGLCQAVVEAAGAEGCAAVLVPEVGSLRVVEAEMQVLQAVKGLEGVGARETGVDAGLGREGGGGLWGKVTGSGRLAALEEELL